MVPSVLAAVGPVRYGTDLGRLSSRCGAPKHGTYSAYQRGCRCPHAREAHRIYQKRLREGRRVDRLVNACGVRRRIQALWAIGHTCDVISAATRGQYSATHIFGLTKREFVTTPTRDAIAAAYRQLSAVPGRSKRSRSRAVAAGWPSPMRWGTDIDDPAADPEPDDCGPAVDDVIDETAVERVLAGERLALTGAEVIAVLQAGVARGVALSRLAEQLSLSQFTARKLLGGSMLPRKEKTARIEAEVLRSSASDYVIAAQLGVHRSSVGRARARLAASGVPAS